MEYSVPSNYKLYIPENNIITYIKRKSNYKQILREMRLRKMYVIPNLIKIDLNFFSIINSISKNENIFDCLEKEGFLEGKMYHPNQLFNLIGYKYNILIDEKNKLHLQNENRIIELSSFVNNVIYGRLFYEYLENIQFLYHDGRDCKLYILLFIGSETNVKLILEYLIKYNKIEDFGLSICFKNERLFNMYMNDFTIHFQNILMYRLKDQEYGNDIIPTIMMFHHCYKLVKFDYIIKIHTKNNINWIKFNLDYITKKKMNDLKDLLKNNNTICHSNFMIPIKKDKFNKILIEKYGNYINFDKSFCAGSIFFTHISVYHKIIDFLRKNQYQSFFNQTMYESNIILEQNSPIHFLERLFGTIH